MITTDTRKTVMESTVIVDGTEIKIKTQCDVPTSLYNNSQRLLKMITEAHNDFDNYNQLSMDLKSDEDQKKNAPKK